MATVTRKWRWDLSSVAMAEVVWSEMAGPPTNGPDGSLEGDLSADAVVIGLGGSGLSAVSELVSRGVDVVGIDAGEVASGAAGRNGGFLLGGLAHSYDVAVDELGRDRALAIYRETLGEIARTYDSAPSSARNVGSLRIAADDGEAEACSSQHRAMAADGLPVQLYEGPEGRGLLFPEDGALQPVERCRMLAASALGAGARLFVHSRVTELSPGRVTTLSGSVAARSVIVCVDGGVELVVPALRGVVRSVRLQMLATARLGRVVASRPVYRRHGFDYWQQAVTGEVVLGGCRDIGGESEWTTDATPSAPVQGALDRLLRTIVGPDAVVTHRWAGIVGYTTTGLPAVRAVAPGVFVAAGYCGTGNVIGALAGRALVELALEGSSTLAQLLDGA